MYGERKEMENLELLKDYADEKLYKQCISHESLSAEAALIAFSNIHIAYSLPENITSENISKLNKAMEKSGLNMSKIVNDSLSEAIKSKKKSNKILKTSEFKKEYTEYSKNWETSVVD